MNATAPHDTLHPRIAELFEELDAARAELHRVVSEMPAAVKDAPARGEAWSIAHVLEHLAIVEDAAGRIVSKIVHEAEAGGARETETSPIRGRNDAFGIATNETRITAPERTRPTGNLSVEESMARLETARERVKEVLRRASGVALGAATHPHPIFGPMDGYQWALATAQHERRHIGQMRRIAGTTS